MWGVLYFDPLNDSEDSDEYINPVKYQIRVVDLSLGSGTYAAVSTDGKLYLWGNTFKTIVEEGQDYFSDEDYEILREPKVFELPELVKQVSARGSHIAVLSISGNVYAWGWGDHGVLGIGYIKSTIHGHLLKSLNILYDEPNKLNFPSPISFIHSGPVDMSAITEDGTLYMWGWNLDDHIVDRKQITPFKDVDMGDINRGNIPYPIQIDIGLPVEYIVSGGSFIIAVTTDSIVNYWGTHYYRPE